MMMPTTITITNINATQSLSIFSEKATRNVMKRAMEKNRRSLRCSSKSFVSIASYDSNNGSIVSSGSAAADRDACISCAAAFDSCLSRLGTTT